MIMRIKLEPLKNSISPNTKNFREFKDFVKKNKSKFKGKNIGIFCTGGIRCEKALHSFEEEGLTDIHQLQGGILNFYPKQKINLFGMAIVLSLTKE